jgi:putative salt-induced outer membrane protein YdiY
MGFALLLTAQLRAQAWLNDQSYRPPPSLPLPAPTPEAIPNVPAEGLFEPPPPLEMFPPSVFEQAVEPQSPSPVITWYMPWTWIPLDGWTNSAELGLNGTSGNAESMSLQAGTRFRRKTDINMFDFRLTHNRTNAGGIETQNNALLFADFERFIGQTPWTYFVKNGLEYDEFRAFNVRYNINSGLGYTFAKTDKLLLIGRFGAGTSREFGGPDDSWVPEALFGSDYEHQLNERHKLIARVDYFPEWGNFNNFRLVADVAWEYLLDSDGNLSFKLGATDRYDSTPNGLKPNDVNYAALLLYKF